MRTYIVESTAICKLEYEPETKLAKIYFNSNPNLGYDFFDVPEEKVTAFAASESKGRYYHQNLKMYARKETK